MNADRIQRLRIEYGSASLDPGDVSPDPFAQFERWFGDAVGSGIVEPNAMALATADRDGRPSVRTVLMKDFDRSGFVFYTNLDSDKGRQISGNAHVSLCFTWLPLHRQVRISGVAASVGDAEADEYFSTRPRQAQLGAHASQQSRIIPDRTWLEDRLAAAAVRFGDGPIPRPDTWGGYRVTPDDFEFWQGRDSRLHDRVSYRLDGTRWIIVRLAP